MKKYLMMVVVVLVFGFSIWNGLPALAKEHGGKEHGGGEMAMMGPMLDESEVATVKEAADAVRATNPDLASKLDKIAEKK